MDAHNTSAGPESALARLAASPFVGRAPLIDAARGAFDAARSGRGQSLLFWGEAGIGKSRFSDEVVGLGQLAGFRPVMARCHELDGAPALWPWIQITRRLVEALPAETRADFLRGPGKPLEFLLLDRNERGAGPSGVVPDRYSVFDATAQLAARAAKEAPLLIVIDDLHWADPASVLLLRYIVRELRFEPVVCIGLYRDDEIEEGESLGEAMGALVRESDGFRLEGLAADEVGHLVSHVAGFETAEVFLSALRAHTGGNPLFMVEILRLLASEDRLGDPSSAAAPDSIPLPRSVRQTLARRLDALGLETQHLLQQASVLGRDFEREVLVAAMGPDFDVAGGLEEAVAARLVEALPNRVAGFRFVHDLVRETVDAALSPVERANLHGCAAEALRMTRPSRLDDHYAALAVHYLEAAQAPSGGADGRARQAAMSAYEYAVLGARRATSRFSFELAAQLLRQSQRALDLAAGLAVAGDTAAPDEKDLLRRRGEASILMGDALWQAGQGAEAEAADREALEIARRLAEPELLARAAIGLSGRNDLPLDPPAEHVDLLREAHRGLSQLNSALRVRVLSQLVRASSYGDESAQLIEWAKEGIAIAEKIGDPGSLFAARESLHYALLLPAQLEERLAVSKDLPALAREVGSVRLETIAWLWRAFDLLQVPDIVEADRAIARLDELARRMRQPFWEWLALGVAACRAQMEGHLDEVERLVFKALEVGQRAATPNALLFFGTQLFHLRAEQRRVDELLPVMEQIVRDRPALVVFRIGVPLIHALAGRREEARKTFEAVAALDFEDVPEDFHALPMLCSSAAVAAFLGDVPRARILREAIRGHAGRVMMAGVCTYWGGAVDHSLGRLEEALGDDVAAERHYAAAVEIAGRAGARLHEAHAMMDRARVLERRKEATSCAEAERIRDAANRIYLERGIHEPFRILPTIAMAHSEVVEGRSLSGIASREDLPVARIEKRDHVWRLAYHGGEIELPDSKGLHYLERLLSAPEEEIHVLDLIAMTTMSEPEGRTERGPGAANGAARLVEGSLDSVDGQALAAYRERLIELARDREAAESERDLSRLDAIDAESASIAAELERDTGLGGRIRRTNGATERARKAVYNRLRASIKRIGQQHESLGRHLERSVATGSVCAYRPDGPVRWKVG